MVLLAVDWQPPPQDNQQLWETLYRQWLWVINPGTILKVRTFLGTELVWRPQNKESLQIRDWGQQTAALGLETHTRSHQEKRESRRSSIGKFKEQRAQCEGCRELSSYPLWGRTSLITWRSPWKPRAWSSQPTAHLASEVASLLLGVRIQSLYLSRLPVHLVCTPWFELVSPLSE